MEGRIFSANGDVIRRFHYDRGEDRILITTSQDVRPHLEQNKQARNDNPGGWSKSREMRRIASLPLSVVERWLIADGLSWHEYMSMRQPEKQKYLRRKLNDPDNAHLRTVDGRI